MLFAIIYVVMQLLLMLVVYLAFGINLFEVDKNPQTNFSVILSTFQLKWLVVFNQLFGILLPALVFLLILYRGSISAKIDLRVPERFEIPLLALALLILSFPLIQFLAQLNLKIPIPEFLQLTSGEIDLYMEKIMLMDNARSMIVNLLLIALLPAIAEELFFRGMLQKELLALFKNKHLAILITSIVFSAFHFQFEGFLPRLGLGLILGYAYMYTRSFFIPVLMHFTNNAIMIFTLYLYSDKMDEIPDENSMEPGILIILISCILVVYLLHILKTKSKKHAT